MLTLSVRNISCVGTFAILVVHIEVNDSIGLYPVSVRLGLGGFLVCTSPSVLDPCDYRKDFCGGIDIFQFGAFVVVVIVSRTGGFIFELVILFV